MLIMSERALRFLLGILNEPGNEIEGLMDDLWTEFRVTTGYDDSGNFVGDVDWAADMDFRRVGLPTDLSRRPNGGDELVAADRIHLNAMMEWYFDVDNRGPWPGVPLRPRRPVGSAEAIGVAEAAESGSKSTVKRGPAAADIYDLMMVHSDETCGEAADMVSHRVGKLLRNKAGEPRFGHRYDRRTVTVDDANDIASAALHAACFEVQSCLGVTDGDHASAYWTGTEEALFKNVVSKYVMAEVNLYAEDDKADLEIRLFAYVREKMGVTGEWSGSLGIVEQLDDDCWVCEVKLNGLDWVMTLLKSEVDADDEDADDEPAADNDAVSGTIMHAEMDGAHARVSIVWDVESTRRHPDVSSRWCASLIDFNAASPEKMVGMRVHTHLSDQFVYPVVTSHTKRD